MEFIAKNVKTVETMLDQVDTMESCSDPAKMQSLVTQTSTSLLKLKSIQRVVLDSLKDANSALQEKRAELEKQSMTLQSLEYEKAFLQREIEAEVSTPQLERMCREETQTSSDDNVSKTEVMNTFLCGSKDVSYEDPSKYQQVLAKLHKEINLRGSLERDAIQLKKTLIEKQKSLEQNQSFLKELPRKLAQVEKASLPLQKFFGTDDNDLLIGTERSKRLEMARSLPRPLYTLFVQLQSYLDASPEPGVSVDVANNTSKNTADDAWFEADEHVVQLHFQVPDTKNKQVTIDFVYFPKLNIVTAQATGSGDKVDLTCLLVNVFPGDEGTMIWSADNVHLKEQAETSMSGRPYHWCNYLAGIHQLPPASGSLDPISTKAIVKELLVRLNANSTLTSILTILKKNPHPIPTHSSWSGPSDTGGPPSTKLVGWTEEKQSTSNADDSDYRKTFVATLKNKNSKLKATATVDMSRYPWVPPKWTLTTEGGESWGEQHGSMEALEQGTNPLYDNTLGQMERCINSQLEELVAPNDKETYNWILAHQLHRLVRLCDEYSQSSGAGQVPRSIKGKDRVAI